MTESEFVTYAQRAADLDSEDHAERLAEATLQELGRNVSPGQADDLADRLPERYGDVVTDVHRQEADPEPVEEFLETVAEEADLDGRSDLEAEVRPRIRGVMGAVAEYAGEDELSNAADQLPPEYGDVVEPADVPVEETFVDAVASGSDLDEDEARTAAEATLPQLGRRLTQGQAEELAAYLSGDAGEWLLEEHSTDAEDVRPEEFVERVAVEADVSEDRAAEYIAEVTDVLAAVVPGGEIDDAIDQLPDEYGELLRFN